jgi:hypothetical protein
MSQPQTVVELQRMIDELDGSMDKLRALLAQGARIRETLLKQQLAMVWEGGDKRLVRIVRDDP